MSLPDEVHVGHADGLISLQIRDTTARMAAWRARAVADVLNAHADEVDPRPVMTEPGA